MEHETSSGSKASSLIALCASLLFALLFILGNSPGRKPVTCIGPDKRMPKARGASYEQLFYLGLDDGTLYRI